MAIAFGQKKNRTLRALNFIGHDLTRETTAQTTQTFTLPSGWQPGDIAIISGWWDSPVTISTPAGWTMIGNNEDGSEYPEGRTCYRILQSGDSSTVSMVCDTADYCSGVLLVFRANTPVTSVTSTGFAYADGPSALNTTLSQSGTVSSTTTHLNLYFLTGRQQDTYIQNPTPTFVTGGWTYFDGEGVVLPDYMDYAYKVRYSGESLAGEQITTNDTGRQGHHIIYLTLSGA